MKQMKLEVYRSLWGYPGEAEPAIRAIDRSLYDGVEVRLPLDPPQRERVQAALAERGLSLITLTEILGATPEEQLENFRIALEEAVLAEPERIAMHSGRDSWPLATSIEFYASVVEIEREFGTRVAHETHRERPLSTPWSTAAILEAVPDLALCCDFSHWVVVCERLLEDQEDAVRLAAERSLHLHARVGSEQAPQVQDPSAPDSQAQLAAFERWWDWVWEAQAEAGSTLSTLTPEYGPPAYQQITDEPSRLEEKLSAICDWQARRARQRFEGKFRSE